MQLHVLTVSLVASVLIIISLPSVQPVVVSGTCDQNQDGSRCHFVNRPWQKDFVCRYNTNTRTGQCLGPDTFNLKLSIVVRYRSLSSKNRGGRPITDLYIRGSGPGLSWDSGLKMNKSAKAVDKWTADISYTANSNGLPCVKIDHCALNQKALEFRLYQDTFGNEGMKGPNMYITLPISNSITGTISFRAPEISVYPWFYKNHITTKSFTFTTSEEVASTKLTVSCILLYPPSFNENIRKKYSLVIMLGISKEIIPLLEYLFVFETTVDEVFVLLIEHSPQNDAEKRITLLPFNSTVELRCLHENDIPGCIVNCQNCWHPNRKDPCEKQEFIDQSKRCLMRRYFSGIGEPFMESIIEELIVKVQDYAGNRLEYDPPRQRVTLMAHTDLSVLALHTALLQPNVIGSVACFSPRFFLPVNETYETQSRTLEIINEQYENARFDIGLQALYHTQRYYFDHGIHDNFNFPLADSFTETENVINRLKEKFSLQEHVNIFHYLYPTAERLSYATKTPPDIISRIRYPLMRFHSPQGGPDRDFGRAIKVTESFIAKRRAILANTTTSTTTNTPTPSNGNASSNNNTINSNGEFCLPTNCNEDGVPLGVFIGALVLSTIVSVVITVILMCLREGSKKAAEKEEQEEKELLEDLSSSDEIEDLD